MPFLTGRFVHFIVLLALVAGIVGVRLADPGWVRAVRYMVFDAYNRLEPREAGQDVFVVDLDETSMARPELGQWPWPRDILADLVERLEAAGARAVTFDMVFAEPDRTSPSRLAGKTGPDHDRIFAQAIREAGNVVTGFIWSAQDGVTRRPPFRARAMLVAQNAKDLTKTLPVFREVTTNIPVIAEAAAGNGLFGVSPSLDGIIRGVPLLFGYEAENGDRQIYPSLALEALRVAEDPGGVIQIRKRRAAEMGPFEPPYLIRAGGYEIPVDADGMLYGYYAPFAQERYIPAWKVLAGDFKPGLFKDKIVVIGTSAEGLKDIRSTPLNLFIPGVDIHVNTIDQVMRGEILKRPLLVEGAELLLTALVGLGIVLLAPFVGTLTFALFLVLVSGALVATSWAAFEQAGLLIDPSFPIFSVVLIFMTSSIFSYLRSEADRRRIRTAFGLYISPGVMQELTANPERLKLGGEVRDLSVMFTDIRGFTGISERLTPEDLIRLMNDFLTPMSDIVMTRRGTIDKYMGDAMMAFWGAPLDDPDHARNACRAALEMNGALAPINDRLAKEGFAPDMRLAAGIGINTGPCSVGNMGSRQRFAYSALGDAVNLASRLESQTRQYGVQILIGEETRAHIEDFATLELDLLRVKGKTQPVRIYTILGDEALHAEEDFQAFAARHAGMLAAMRSRDFGRAGDLCAALQAHPAASWAIGPYYEMMTARLATFKNSPPPDDWDGVFIAQGKH